VSGESRVPAALQAALLVRILAYDHRIGSRSGEVVVAILSDSDSGADFAQALLAISREATVAGRALRIVPVRYASPAQTRAALLDLQPAAVYVPEELNDVAGIARVTRDLSILSFSSNLDGVHSGLSIGLVRRAERAAIIISRRALGGEAAALDAGLLHLCEVVEATQL
jgi:hypothetical protein